MSATAFKNVVRRREHYERSQPAARSKFGLLEKHKDYVARARNFHDKERRIQQLKLKAANRNPDEFYHKMQSTSTRGGQHRGESERQALTGDMLHLLKTQDLAYIQAKKSSEDHKIERLKSSLHLLSAGPLNKHTVFVDTPEAAAAFDAPAYFDTDPALVGRAFNRPTTAALASNDVTSGGDSGSRRERKRSAKLRDRSYAELEERVDRSAKMRKLSEQMALESELLKKGRRTKISTEDGAPVYKWKSQRKR